MGFGFMTGGVLYDCVPCLIFKWNEDLVITGIEFSSARCRTVRTSLSTWCDQQTVRLFLATFQRKHR